MGTLSTDLATGNKETYTGLTDGTIRDRISKHEGDCCQRDRPETRLSAHMWDLKDKGHTYSITWQILARASSYNPSSGMCCLCRKDKFFIMFDPATASLNKRNEVYNTCRHRASKLLDKT